MRIIRIALDVNARWDADSGLTVNVSEVIRQARPRLISSFMVGDEIHSGDIDIAVQIAEDALRAAVGRTLGVHDRLPF